MKRFLNMAMLAGIMAVSMAGCTDPIPAYQDQFGEPLQVSMTDVILQSQLRVSVMPPQRVGAGQLRVMVQVRNLTDSDRSVDYKYWFTDEKGAQVENPGGWQFVKLAPRGTGQFDFTSLTAAARDFRVQLRPAQ